MRNIIFIIIVLSLCACAHNSKPIQAVPIPLGIPKVDSRPFAINGLYLGMSSMVAVTSITNAADGDYKIWHTYQEPYYKNYQSRKYLDGMTSDNVSTLQMKGLIITNRQWEDGLKEWKVTLGLDAKGKVNYIEYSSSATQKFMGFEEDDDVVDGLGEFFGVYIDPIKFFDGGYKYKTQEWELWANSEGEFCLYKL